MKPSRKELLRAAVAIILAIAATIFIGASIGYPRNPDAFRARLTQLTTLAEANPGGTPAEIDAIFNTPSDFPISETPPAVIAIMQWHYYMLGSFVFITLLIARPRLKEISFIILLVSLLLALTAGLAPAICVVMAAIGYALMERLIPGLRRSAA